MKTETKEFLKPILIEFNKFIESGCLDEFECSEDWMIEFNVNYFIDEYVNQIIKDK